MQPSAIYEIIGYAASLLVAFSLMMKSILKLRVINLIGSIFFTIYGLLIQAYPVAAVNFFIVLINIYYLWEIIRAKEFFRLLEVRPDSEYLRAFLDYYRADIEKFQPGFQPAPPDSGLVLFVLRNMVPAGLVTGEIRGGDSLYVALDYAIPGYRDLKIGRFVFEQNAGALRARGIRKIYAAPGAPAHIRYLLQIGFAAETQPDGKLLYCKKA